MQYNRAMSKQREAQKGSLGASFYHAGAGIGWAVAHERNLQLHLVASVAVLLLGSCLPVSTGEWLVLLVFLVLIPVLELLNTALEQLCDTVRDELHLSWAETKIPRDLAAGAVLYATVGAIVAGVVIFVPKLWALIFVI